MPRARAHAVYLRLGGQSLELMSFAQPGAPYPTGIAGTDTRFQHFAIVVGDVAAAYGRLLQCSGWTPITQAGPQRLPESSGGVCAFKFRDPEGHPLELLAFPPPAEPLYWQQARRRNGRHDGAQAGITEGGGAHGGSDHAGTAHARTAHGRSVCLGIDHSAIAVASTARSVEFYRDRLQFSVAGGSVNHGREQALLDDVPRPVVEVTALRPASTAPPHLELLCYRSMMHAEQPLPRSNDVAATQLVCEADDHAALVRALAHRCGTTFISRDPLQDLESTAAVLLRDPDGHLLRLTRRASLR
jgi:catechol 2,3-dioxygenase-like lactoylglutathione lyase family enzyme